MNEQELYEQVIELIEEHKNFDEAEKLVDQIFDLNPESAAAFNCRGVIALQRRQLDDAIDAFDSAIYRDPGFFKAYNNRAWAFWDYPDYERALFDFQEAFRLAPDFTAALRGIGQTLLQLGRTEQAVDQLAEYLKLDPNQPRVLGCLGLALTDAEEYERALQHLDRAIEISPEDYELYQWRASALQYLEEYDVALADLTLVLEHQPDDPLAWKSRGYLYIRMDEYEAARSDLTRSLELEPRDDEVLYYRALCWVRLDQLEKAIQDLTAALGLSPGYQAALKDRLGLWEELGEYQKAEQDFQRLEQLQAEPRSRETPMQKRKTRIVTLLENHFGADQLESLAITERTFPLRVRADLQLSLDKLIKSETTLLHFCSVHQQRSHEGLSFSALLLAGHHDSVVSEPPQYDEVDIGEQKHVKCLKRGLWLGERSGVRFALLLDPSRSYGYVAGLRVQIAVIHNESGTQLTEFTFKYLEKSVAESTCYRGKILSFQQESDYSGVSTGITVHKLKSVAEHEVILPATTLKLLNRNVIDFVHARPRLRERGISTKKGLLFYGPPGTGKTHTIQYLAEKLEGHTTLIITAEQVGLLGEYMTLARLLQPTMVVIEDIDLIARDRTHMDSACEELMLNKLLNEMDGLQQNSDVIFVLTTNRPESLEAALASRPGRIDQAIEFPLPDDVGRAKLIRLYSGVAELSDSIVNEIVKRTANVSAAFIKELMRRSMQFQLQRSESAKLELQDIEAAIDELLFSGGSLNRKLLGAHIPD